MTKWITAKSEWVHKLTDLYWIRVRDSLREAGYPDFIATPAAIQMQQEDGMNVAYGVFAHTPKNIDLPEWVCESEVS